jgi:hypothetical protein
VLIGKTGTTSDQICPIFMLPGENLSRTTFIIQVLKKVRHHTSQLDLKSGHLTRMLVRSTSLGPSTLTNQIPHPRYPTWHRSGTMQKLLRSPPTCPTGYQCRLLATAAYGKVSCLAHRTKRCQGEMKIISGSNLGSPTSDWKCLCKC